MTSSGVSKIMNAMALARGSEAGSAAEKSSDFDLMLSRKTADAEEPIPDQAEPFREKAGLQPLSPVVSGGAEAVKTQQSFEKEKSTAALERIPKAEDNRLEKTMTAETENAYEDWKKKVTEAVKEKFGVTEEELEKAMEALGITFADLLSGDGLLKLSMELTGTEDMTDLLFDGSFQELMQEINALTGQLTDQADMTPEELQMVLQKAMEGMEESGKLPEGTESLLSEADQALQKADGNQVVFQTELNRESVRELGDSKNAQSAKELADSRESGEGILKEPEKAVLKQEPESSQSGQKELAGQGKEEFGESVRQTADHDPGNQQMNFHTTIQNTVTNLGEGVVQTVERMVNVQDVINQISEFTRVTVTQDVSRLEMQLNPEHLGRLYMQLTSKEGVITAQLIAQNEAVKQALESQANVLKENMNQQGMKVEAVEVTIASHEFEEHFREDQQMEQQQEQADNHRPRRFLSADQLDEFAGQLSEEDSLAAKIMVENGNSVDMSA